MGSPSVNRQFINYTFDTFDFRTIIPGRVAKFRAWGPNGNICVLAVHLVPDLPERELQHQLHTINMHLPNDPSILTILMGDVNAHPAEEPRLVVGDPYAELSPSKYTVAFENTLGDLLEVSGDYFTFAAKGADNVFRFSRLDRFFIRGPTIDTLDRHPQARATHNLLDGSTPSDHSPVSVQLMPINMSPVKSNAIPHWIVRHPVFEGEAKRLMADLMESKERGLIPTDGQDPHGMRDEMKQLLHRAGRSSIEQLRHGPPGTTADRLSRALAGYRSWRSGQREYLYKLCARFPELGSHFDKTSGDILNHTRFHDFLGRLAKEHYNKELEDATDSTKSDANDRSRKITLIQQLSMAWRTCSRRIALTDILPPEPNNPAEIATASTTTSDTSSTLTTHPVTQAAAYLAQYWRQVFAAGRTVQAACDHLLWHAPGSLPDHDWDVGIHHFEEAIDNRSSSAPGPDGIPFGALANIGKEFAEVLHKIFMKASVNYKDLPPDFNEALMVFLPKGADPRDSATSAAREPGATRPLTLSNTDSKVYSRVLNSKMASYAPLVIHEAQRGFVRGRSITDNIIEIEGIALSQVAHCESSVALIGFDIKAAFPSLSHYYMWKVLARYGIPRNIVQALKALYYKHRVVLRMAGKIFPGFDIFSGIKQGCPSSGTIFAFALDPFIRYLLLKIPPPALHIRAFADDLGAVLIDVLRNFRPLAVAFALLRLAACLAVHPAKTQIALLTNGDGIDLQRTLVEAGGEWHAAKILDHILYLGARIGPNAHERYWHETIMKLQAAANKLAAMDLAPPSALRWFSIAVQSIPAYLGSMRPPSPALVRAEALAVTKVINIPHQSIPIYTLATLNDLSIPIKLNTVWYQSLAARCRVYMKSPLMPRLLDDFRSRRAQDDAFYIYPHKGWLHQTCLIALEQAYHTVHALNPSLHFTLTNNIQRDVTRWIWNEYVPQHRKHATLYLTLSRRLAKRNIHMPVDHIRDAMTQLRTAMGKVPTFVQFAFLKFICNAWTTTARFNREILPCRWCGVRQGDDLRHYAACSTMLTAMADLFPQLHASWAVINHPPSVPLVLPCAYGIGLPSTELAVDLLNWVDFMAFMYSCRDFAPAGDWRLGWSARARVRHRYGYFFL